jgi:hypothetical protein
VSRAIAFESAASAVYYAEDAIARALRDGNAFIPRDSGPLRRRLARAKRASLPEQGPCEALARYAERMLEEGRSMDYIRGTWGCDVDSIKRALELWPSKPAEQLQLIA